MNQKRIGILLALLIVAASGNVLLGNVLASLDIRSVESESSVLSHDNLVQSDALASGSEYIRFDQSLDNITNECGRPSIASISGNRYALNVENMSSTESVYKSRLHNYDTGEDQNQSGPLPHEFSLDGSPGAYLVRFYFNMESTNPGSDFTLKCEVSIEAELDHNGKVVIAPNQQKAVECSSKVELDFANQRINLTYRGGSHFDRSTFNTFVAYVNAQQHESSASASSIATQPAAEIQNVSMTMPTTKHSWMQIAPTFKDESLLRNAFQSCSSVVSFTGYPANERVIEDQGLKLLSSRNWLQQVEAASSPQEIYSILNNYLDKRDSVARDYGYDQGALTVASDNIDLVTKFSPTPTTSLHHVRVCAGVLMSDLERIPLSITAMTPIKNIVFVEEFTPIDIGDEARAHVQGYYSEGDIVMAVGKDLLDQCQPAVFTHEFAHAFEEVHFNNASGIEAFNPSWWDGNYSIERAAPFQIPDFADLSPAQDILGFAWAYSMASLHEDFATTFEGVFQPNSLALLDLRTRHEGYEDTALEKKIDHIVKKLNSLDPGITLNGLKQLSLVPNSDLQQSIADDARFPKQGVIKGSAGDRVWLDDNGNGIQDANEKGINGVLVKVVSCESSTTVRSATTDADGRYVLDIDPGQYLLEVSVPDGYTITDKDRGSDEDADNDFDQDSRTGCYYIDADTNAKDIDAGLIRQ